MRQLFFLSIIAFTIACSSKSEKISSTSSINSNNDSARFKSDSIINENDLSFETYENNQIGWGYQIYQNGHILIDQPHIPSVQGNKGFSSQFKAAIAAQFIIGKLENNIFPPSFSIQELDSLGLLD